VDEHEKLDDEIQKARIAGRIEFAEGTQKKMNEISLQAMKGCFISNGSYNKIRKLHLESSGESEKRAQAQNSKVQILFILILYRSSQSNSKNSGVEQNSGSPLCKPTCSCCSGIAMDWQSGLDECSFSVRGQFKGTCNRCFDMAA